MASVYLEEMKRHLNKGYSAFGSYHDERVRIDNYDREGSLYIWIPSRQEAVWVPGDKVEILEY